MGKLLPVILAVIGLGGGVGAGLVLRPAPDASSAHAEDAADHGDGHAEDKAHAAPCPPAAAADGGHGDDGHGDTTNEFVEFNNQFVVPVIEEGAIEAMMVLSLSVEVTSGNREKVYEQEPKLRDAFLRVLFDHGATGGFDEALLNSAGLDALQRALRETAVKSVGSSVTNVYIADLVKQKV